MSNYVKAGSLCLILLVLFTLHYRQNQQLQELTDWLVSSDEAQDHAVEKVAQLSQKVQELTTQLQVLEQVTGQATDLPLNTQGWNRSIGIATAFAPHDNISGICASGDPNSTAIGVNPMQGTIAVDPKRIPYGSEILVVYSDGTFEFGLAGDTGGALRSDPLLHIDVYRRTHAEAIKHGTKHVLIYWRENSK